MTWGHGVGAPLSGVPPVPVADPRSEVGASPIVIDFSDEPDQAGLPGPGWEFLSLATDAGGLVTGSPEPAASTYWSVVGGLARWGYLRTPPAGLPAVEQGYVAAPVGILDGRNAEAVLALAPPTDLLDTEADAFVFDVTVGFRCADDASSYVGGRVRAEWASGVWTTPVAVEVVQASGGPVTVLASYTFAPDALGSDITNIWRNAPLHVLQVTLRGQRLDVFLDGAWTAFTLGVPLSESSKPFIFAQVGNIVGTTFTAVPFLASVSLRTLRDLERLGPPPALPGDVDLEAAPVPMLQLPLDELVAAGYLKRTGGRAWEFVAEVTTDVFGIKYRWNIGNVVRALEPHKGAVLVPVIIDLAALRYARER